MYQVFGPIRTRCLRVLWALEEIGAPYEWVSAPPRTPEVVALNPSGKVPVLVSEGTAIHDSTAIITYLADKHAALTFPPGTLERARQDALTQQVLDEIEGLIWMAARHTFVLPPEHRIPEIKDSLRWEFARNQTLIADRLGDGPFLMGETFTLPDIVLGHCLRWAEIAKFEVTDPRLIAYGETLFSRPAVLRALTKG